MADRSSLLILEALQRAVADPAGLPLHGTKAQPGLFATTAAAKQAAQACKDQGFVQPVRTEARGKTTLEYCAITEKGLAHLLGQVSPRQVLEAFVRSLEERRAQVDRLVDSARESQASLDALRKTAEKVLHQIHQRGAPALPLPTDRTHASANGSETWLAGLVKELSDWQASGALEDCPVPTLYHKVRQGSPGLSIGKFHDGLRRLHEEGRVYLHPWTGPLYEIPEPALALLVGHEIAYYVSLKN